MVGRKAGPRDAEVIRESLASRPSITPSEGRCCGSLNSPRAVAYQRNGEAIQHLAATAQRCLVCIACGVGELILGVLAQVADTEWQRLREKTEAGRDDPTLRGFSRAPRATCNGLSARHLAEKPDSVLHCRADLNIAVAEGFSFCAAL